MDDACLTPADGSAPRLPLPIEDAVDLVSHWSGSHVCKKVHKAIPPLANTDAAATPIFVTHSVRVVTSAPHGLPRRVGGSLSANPLSAHVATTLSVDKVLLQSLLKALDAKSRSNLFLQATARLCGAFCNHLFIDCLVVAAVAFEQPSLVLRAALAVIRTAIKRPKRWPVMSSDLPLTVAGMCHPACLSG